ncbi:MAG TPA: hypothetical protein VN493_15365 [Thermoanaerobaculia bacterium]|nr:hypothetical protein [Thermoanaerobaculia bacterium]
MTGSEPRWLVLGFDARESPRRLAGSWPPERREGYLYRPDVESPLSADRTVWPSVFERMPDRLPAWTGRVQGLWEDLSQLRQAASGVDDCWLVAFAVDLASCSERAERELEEYLSGFTPGGQPGPRPGPQEIASPHALDSGWEWLGCDVSDFFGTSGLSNTGFPDIGTLRPEWGPRLNCHHLFDDPRDARGFQAMADERASEHSPFFVMGLWRIG